MGWITLWRGSPSTESARHCRRASDHKPGFDACYKPDETNPSWSDSFKAVSVSSKDDPAQSPIPPCAVSFCLVSSYQPSEKALVYSTGKCSASIEKLPVPKLHPIFARLIIELFILVTVSPRSYILPHNTSPLFKPARQLPCFNSKVAPHLPRFQCTFTIYCYISCTGKSLS